MTITIELSRYRNKANIEFITYFYNVNKDKKELDEIISEAAVATNIPCLVCCYFLLEIIGDSDELWNIIKKLTTFYGYDGVKE